MTWLKAIGTELWGLFVDDGLLVVLSLAWIGAVVLGLRGLWPEGGHRALEAAAFAIGFLLILAESVTRAARRARKKRMSATVVGRR